MENHEIAPAVTTLLNAASTDTKRIVELIEETLQTVDTSMDIGNLMAVQSYLEQALARIKATRTLCDV